MFAISLNKVFKNSSKMLNASICVIWSLFKTFVLWGHWYAYSPLVIFIILCYMFFFILLRKLKIAHSKTAEGGGISLRMALQYSSIYLELSRWKLLSDDKADPPPKKIKWPYLVMHPDGNVFRMAPQKRLSLAKILGRVTAFQRHLVIINNNYYSTTLVNNQFTDYEPLFLHDEGLIFIEWEAKSN